MNYQKVKLKVVKPINPLELLNFTGRKRVPLILQSEVAECGLASLAMVSSYYGYQINISTIRKYSVTGFQGMSLKQLMEVSTKLHLTPRAVKCDFDSVSKLNLPCVIHWDLDHFVVLTKVTNSSFFINDPAIGKRKLTYRQFSDSYTGVALELTLTSDFKKKDVRQKMQISHLWEKIIGLKRTLSLLFLLSIMLQFIALLSPYYMQMVIDNVLLSNDKALLIVLAIGYFILVVIQIIISSARSWLTIRLNSCMNIQMGANLFNHLMRLSLGYFEKRHIGDVVSRFSSLNSIRDLLTTGIIETIIDGLVAIVVLVMMYFYSPILSGLVSVIVIISFLIQLLFFYPNRRIVEESIVASAKEDSAFLESIRAIQPIKLFSHETTRQNTWLNRYAEVINADIRLGRLNITEGAISRLIWGLEATLVIYLGALSVMEGSLTVGMMLAFIAYKGQFTSSMTAFLDKIIAFKLLSLHLERISDITLEKKEKYNSSIMLPREIKGHIKVENLSFRYTDSGEWILKDVNIEIKAGESVVIIGSSGCGKSTLMKIILGLLKPTSGKVFLDSIDVSQLSLSEYRGSFGAVMQDDKLLSGTLSESLTMFDSNYDEKHLIESCKNACIWEDIQHLPMKLHSLIGDMGSYFSGGQLQRLYLARALYKKPKILCLDESTSHLDQRNEMAINDNMRKLFMTKILIAHRKETIDSAERIINLDN
ncbi:peptidase domain-containing ABC transporter [Vibrio sp. SCSIO 43137]|uniref:peptidase domain-containing ABC transporter n=1 Tax=Vibrio sp. SCSIO 43137 TaxID=3021011 RepID=UPI0023078182|nr:peptidase domain-containing ABC transporter [Vibrio sp. SCSIO 43137]WCE30494.1 peptidase domain-containing ABC transporter [Vibrio sp. SCSIO 43137]